MKVLIVSHNSFSKTFNNGKTLSAIFSAFKKDELCQLFYTSRGKADYDRCDCYYLIENKDALKSIIARKKCGSEILKQNNDGVSQNSKHLKRNGATKLIRDIIFLLSSWLHGGLKTWLDKQKFDLVFYVGGDAIFSQIMAISISKRYRVPLVVYYTDDYIINARRGFYELLLKRFYKNTISYSNMLFAIGEDMAESYSSFFGKQFFPIMNVIDLTLIERYHVIKDEELTISYFGGVHLGRDKEIVRFGEFVRFLLSQFLRRTVIINVYTFTDISLALISEYKKLGISLHSGLTGRELEKAMDATDVFLHVESAEPQYKALTKLSVSTKIPEYMGAGKAIIAFGPSDVASFKVISRANDTLVVDDNKDMKYKDSYLKRIAEVLDDNDALAVIGQSNYNYAKLKFDKNIVAKDFKEKLELVAFNK